MCLIEMIPCAKCTRPSRLPVRIHAQRVRVQLIIMAMETVVIHAMQHLILIMMTRRAFNFKAYNRLIHDVRRDVYRLGAVRLPSLTSADQATRWGRRKQPLGVLWKVFRQHHHALFDDSPASHDGRQNPWWHPKYMPITTRHHQPHHQDSLVKTQPCFARQTILLQLLLA
jgi:hypothetical protein